MAEEKTEKATDRKREQERKKGHIYQSQDLVTAASMLMFFGLLKVMGASIGSSMTNAMRGLLQTMPAMVSGSDDIRRRFLYVGEVCGGVLLPMMLAAVGVSAVVTLAQTRLLLTPGQIAPKFSRISPLGGFKRMFSLRSVVEMIKSILKITVIGAVIYNELSPHFPEILKLYDVDPAQALGWSAQLTLDIFLKAAVAMLLIGVADYFYQWWDYEREMKMSKEEIKDEFKQEEGNPETKSRIRNLQRQLSRRRMMRDVANADVVIRNPTHFAVALKYDRAKKGAPVVVAKGRDNVALRIVEVAEKHNVYITENRPLAQALYRSVEIGDEIPAEFYKAVAEVLAYLYRLKHAGRT